MPEYKLFKEIAKLSVAKDWKEAKKEWILDHIYDAKEAQTCLCGHYPIIEICVIKNTKNNEHALVGNCCVNKFFGIGSNKMFAALKKIRVDSTKSVNKPILNLAYDRKYINDWEKDFYMNILRKRKLSIKQKEKKIAINKKILQKFDQEAI
jgi:hypothetical protein